MSAAADFNACAALVERGDPLRFRAAMAAPVAARAVLFPLYAFNVEVSRAPWVTQEAMIAEMRLQWWRDVCEEIRDGKQVRRHEVATPLADTIRPEDASLLDELAAARRWDIYRDPFEDADHFARYLDQTAGNLAVVAARRLGPVDEAVVRDAAVAAGVAAWLAAIPALEARGRVPLVDGTARGVRSLAEAALARLAAARKRRGAVSSLARPALMHVGAAVPVLQAAARAPEAVADGRLPDPVQTDRFGLPFRVLTGRW
jgi:phytoene/squalene synthetase